MSMKTKRNRGAAILAAILVVAIVATAAAGLLYSQSLWLQESTLSADAAQAWADHRGRCSGLIPGPVSCTLNTMRSSPWHDESVIRPRSGV